MKSDISLNDLWHSAPAGTRTFDPRAIAGLPEPAQSYLRHSIRPGTPLASAVHLRMHGEIKLKGWLPFEAEQVIVWPRGLIWKAAVKMYGLPIKGFDRLVDSDAEMRWRMGGVIPVMTAEGPDIARSAAGRLKTELIWLPSVFCTPGLTWSNPDSTHAEVGVTVENEDRGITLELSPEGRLKSVALSRWGNPEGREFHYADFGGLIDGERTFQDYTIPSKIRAGWYIHTDRFRREGEFFRAVIDHAEYR